METVNFAGQFYAFFLHYLYRFFLSVDHRRHILREVSVLVERVLARKQGKKDESKIMVIPYSTPPPSQPLLLLLIDHNHYVDYFVVRVHAGYVCVSINHKL